MTDQHRKQYYSLNFDTFKPKAHPQNYYKFSSTVTNSRTLLYYETYLSISCSKMIVRVKRNT